MTFAPAPGQNSWLWNVQKLGVGVEPFDSPRRSPISTRVEVAFDVDAGLELPDLPRALQPTGLAALTEPHDALCRFERHTSGRYTVLDPTLQRLADVDSTTIPATTRVRVRLGCDSRRFVPRRLSVTFTSAPVVLRPHLFPGATYDVSARTTAIRGRILYAASKLPARWARVSAMRGTVQLGFAHGDDRGEFLLLVEPPTSLTAFSTTLILDVRVRSFSGPPTATPAQRNDALWDLPVEAIADPSAPELLGRAIPPELSLATTFPAVAVPVSTMLSQDFLV